MHKKICVNLTDVSSNLGRGYHGYLDFVSYYEE